MAVTRYMKSDLLRRELSHSRRRGVAGLALPGLDRAPRPAPGPAARRVGLLRRGPPRAAPQRGPRPRRRPPVPGPAVPDAAAPPPRRLDGARQHQTAGARVSLRRPLDPGVPSRGACHHRLRQPQNHFLEIHECAQLAPGLPFSSLFMTTRAGRPFSCALDKVEFENLDASTRVKHSKTDRVTPIIPSKFSCGVVHK